MIYTDVDLSKDIDRVKQLSIVPSILDVICQTTGMGFAAVARVTEERWIACSVRDDIQFGLTPGDELKIETTICHEIRDSHEPVIIDHVAASEQFCNHHTPLQYGFQSYISFPIILKNGEFFGTLCAIDPEPANLNNPKVIDMFSVFAELIGFHLQNVELIERSQTALQILNRQLTDTINENRQYRHLSNHSLQEPLRKIRLFSGMLLDATEQNDVNKVKDLAKKVNSSAQQFSMMIKDLSIFSTLSDEDSVFQIVNLSSLATNVCDQLSPLLDSKRATVHIAELPSVRAIPLQLEQLFYQLISNAIKFSRKETALVIDILCRELTPDQITTYGLEEHESGFVEIQIIDNGIGIEQAQLEKIFTIFSRLPNNKEGAGIGLALCRKIIQNHDGLIKAQSELGKGTMISIILPI
ncbi:GAF domain-containing sensor histidine kinase [Spirosoma knui]